MVVILLVNLCLFQSRGVFLHMAISAQIFQDAGCKVVMEEIIEVGKHFIFYKVKEVGLIPMGGVHSAGCSFEITSVSLSSFPAAHCYGILPLPLSILSCIWEA